jgi:acyl dehydratase
VPNWARALSSRETRFGSLTAARADGFAGRPVPPVMYGFFLTVSAAQLVEDLGFQWGKTLAAGIAVEVGRIVGDQECVRGQSIVDQAYERVGRDGTVRQFLQLRTEYRDQRGGLVTRWMSTFIERVPERTVEICEQSKDNGLSPAKVPAAVSMAAPSTAQPVRPFTGHLPDRRIGPLNRLDFARMSVALDDPNMVHLDDSVAAAAGFAGVIGSGGYVLAAMYEWARDWAGLERVVRVSVRQKAPFTLDDTLTTTGKIAGLVQHAGLPAVDLEAAITDSAGQQIATGQVTTLW